MKAPAKLLKDGIDFAPWYNIANRQLRELFPDNCGYVADLLALTSPRCHISRNVGFVRSILDGDDYPVGIMPTVHRSLERYRISGKIYGKKTGCFAQNLRGNLSPITLDVHMARAFQVPQKTLFRRDIFERIYRNILRLSNEHGLKPAQTQAAIWAGSLISQNRKPGFFPIELLAK